MARGWRRRPDEDTGRPLGWGRADGVRLAAAGAVLGAWLVALALTPRFPSQDGPTHLQNARLLLELLRGNDWGAAARFFELRPELVPNWLESLLLPSLLAAFGPAVADRLIAAGAVLSFGVALWYALGARSPRGRFLLLAGLPLALNLFLASGFYNYCYGLAASLLLWGFWLRHGAEAHGRTSLAAASGLIALFFIHLVPLLATGVVLGSLAVAAWIERRGTSSRPWGELTRLSLVAAPALLLSLRFLARETTGAHVLPVVDWSGRVARFATADFLVSHHSWELLPATALVVTLLAGTVLALRGRRAAPWRREDGLLLAALILTVVYAVAPDTLPGGGFVTERVLPFPFLALLLWLSTCDFGPRSRRAIEVVGLLIAATVVASQAVAFRAAAPRIREYLSVEAHIEPGATLLPLTFRPDGRDARGHPISLRVGVLAHASGWLAADRPLTTFDDYESMAGHFPVRFRAGVDPYRHLWPRLADDPEGALAEYSRATGVAIDYVLTWDLPDDGSDPDARRLVGAIRHGFTPVYVSPGGRAVLYRRREG